MNKLSKGTWSFIGILLVFPLGHALVVLLDKLNLQSISFFVFLVLGLVLLVVSLRVSSAWEAVLGGLAGLAFWAAVGEIGSGGELYKTQAIWGVVFLVTLFLVFRPGTRCDIFIFIQRVCRLPFTGRAAPSYRGLAIAFEFFYITWVAHMLMLTGYYDPAYGVYSWLTYAVFYGTIIVTPFLLYWMQRTKTWELGIGRGVASVIICWMWVEVLMKWKVFADPWASLNVPIISGVVLLLLATIAAIAAVNRQDQLVSAQKSK